MLLFLSSTPREVPKCYKRRPRNGARLGSLMRELVLKAFDRACAHMAPVEPSCFLSGEPCDLRQRVSIVFTVSRVPPSLRAYRSAQFLVLFGAFEMFFYIVISFTVRFLIVSFSSWLGEIWTLCQIYIYIRCMYCHGGADLFVLTVKFGY